MSEENNIDHLDVIERLIEQSFNCSLKNNKISFSIDLVDEKSIPILLSLPGILITILISLSGDKGYKDNLNSIKEILENNTDNNKTLGRLKTLMNWNPLSENFLKKYSKKQSIKKDDLIKLGLPKEIKTLGFLMHHKLFHFDQSLTSVRLVFALGNYFIIACMIWKSIVEKRDVTFLKLKDINELFLKSEILEEENFNVFSYSLLFLSIMQETVEKSLNSIVHFEEKITYKKSIFIPALNKYLHSFIREEEKGTFFILNDMKERQENYDVSSIIVAYDTNLFVNLGYNLLEIGTIKETAKEEDSDITGAYIFLQDGEIPRTGLDNLINRLYQLAKQSLLLVNKISDSWNNYIDEAEYMIDSQLSEFDDWFFEVIPNYEMRNQLLYFTQLRRIIGNLNNEFDYGGVQEIVKEYESARGYNIQPDVKMKLLKANVELELFIKQARKNNIDEQNLKNYFKTNSQNYTYLKLVKQNAITKIFLTSGGSNMKMNRRMILPLIYKELTNKEIDGFTLNILLGLESPSDSKRVDYSKYA